VERLISAPAFHLKGTGWYATDYAKSNGKSAAKSEDSKSEAKSDGKSETKSESSTERRLSRSPPLHRNQITSCLRTPASSRRPSQIPDQFAPVVPAEGEKHAGRDRRCLNPDQVSIRHFR